MSYPPAGLYYIQCLSKPECFASIRYGDENVLCGESLNSDQYYQKWRLDYVNGASDRPQVFCVLAKEERGGVLGVNSVNNYQAVYSLDNEQSWFLKQTSDAGYMIGQVSDDNEYTWYLGNKDEPIVIVADGSLETQSWQFVLAE